MGKNIKNDTRISKSLTVENWKQKRDSLINSTFVEDHDSNLWEEANELFEDRVTTRFIEPIEWILEKNKNQGEGFAIVALQCILIEFLAALYHGKIYTTSKNFIQPFEYNSSRNLFCNFLMKHAPFSSYFKEKRSADGFYDNIRCGLLHEAKTKQTSIIKKSSQNNLILDFIENDKTNFIIYRENFYDAIKTYMKLYKQYLMASKDLKINFIRKIDDLCEIERVYYFAYGSNLDKDQLIERIGKYHTATKAKLDNYRFEYNKKSTDGTAKANINKQEGAEVLGVCYEIDKESLTVLSSYEKGYNPIEITLQLESNTRAKAIVYISSSLTCDRNPSDGYRSTILKGAKDWGLEEKYIRENI